MDAETIHVETVDHFLLAEEFYRSVNYHHPIEPTATVISAVLRSEITGVVRLVIEEGLLILRGMMVAPERQRQGVGTKMLRELERHIGNRNCYCVANSSLERFYGQIGFCKISDESTPVHLAVRAHKYRASGLDVVTMKRLSE